MSDLVSTLVERNAQYAARVRPAPTSMMPSQKVIVIGCADPRVDPAHVLGLAPGEALVIRNVGGRVSPSTLQTMATLRAIAQAEGGSPGPGWNLVLLQHTDCGITHLADQPELLAGLFAIEPDQVPAKTVEDPRAALAGDIADLRANPFLPGEFIVSGLLYDVATGLVDQVVAPALLRDERVAP
jgi:carbonic anhydrase